MSICSLPSRFFKWLLLTLFFLPALTAAQVQSTKITVRALARDAKFIGTSMGGVQVSIRDVRTGELLARGITSGGTGSTDLLMRQPRDRHDTLAVGNSAGFRASIDLEKPVLAEITGYGPLAFRQAAVTVSTQMWLIPGKDITGDGVILEFPGFVVDVIRPSAHASVEQGPVEVLANVVMMCGCPTADGGLWDSSRFEIEAQLLRSGELYRTVELDFTGEESMFGGRVEVSDPGTYELILTVYDERTGNTGVDKTTFIVG